MRTTGWLIPIISLLTWALCIAFPAIALASLLFFQSPDRQITTSPNTLEIRPALILLTTTLAWSLAVSLGSALLGWLPGRVLGKSLSRNSFIPVAAFLLVPICMPAYVIFFAWWQSWPADTALFKWIIQHQHMQAARHLTLYLGLLCWSWPLVSLCVAASAAARPAQRDEMLLIDGAPPPIRFLDQLRTDIRGLLIGGLLVFLATLNNTTCFDLAEVFTFANELRAIQALGATPRELLFAGLPLMLITSGGAVAVWFLLTSRNREAATRVSESSFPARFITASIWIASLLIPLILFTTHVVRVGGTAVVIKEFFTLYRFSALNTILTALVSGSIAALMSIGFIAAWQDHRHPIRLAASFIAVTWLMFALLPGTTIGGALEAAYNRGFLSESIYSNRAILVIAHLSTFGFIAALLARFTVMLEPQHITDLRRLDGAQTLSGLLRSTWPQVLACAFASLSIVFVMALGEIPVTAFVHPPLRAGHGPLALTLLNDMHYQRPQTVMIAALGIALGATIAAFTLALTWRTLRTMTHRP